MLKVYADFNCPFCFVQHQRLKTINSDIDIEWCMVEHAPHLSSHEPDLNAFQQLESEYQIIQIRAPEATINKPSFCVNTRLAIIAYISLELESPEIANEFLDSVFAAYWQEGKDISSTSVLLDLLAPLGVTTVPNNDTAKELQAMWQNEWQTGDFDTRIPSISTSDHRKLLGLQHIENIQNFIESNIERLASPLACEVISKNLVATLFDSNNAIKRNLDGTLSIIAAYSSLDELEQTQDTPEIILIDFDTDKKINFESFERINRPDSPIRGVPVIYFVKDIKNRAAYSSALTLGATDVIFANDEPSVNISKINRRLSEAKKLRLLTENSTIDSLTGAFNKRQLEISLERFWRIGCTRQVPLAIIMIDIDNFKQYNDTFGHLQGDECLIQVAELLQSRIQRNTDMLARFGGEEFTILLFDSTLESAIDIAESARKTIAEAKIPHAETALSDIVTASFGVCHVQPHADYSPSKALEIADKKLYEAKLNGRNQVKSAKLTPEQMSPKH